MEYLTEERLRSIVEFKKNDGHVIDIDREVWRRDMPGDI